MGLTQQRLREETVAWQGTCGESSVARTVRFEAAFRDPVTGRVELARHEDGRPAPMHLICGLPAEWVIERDVNGRPSALREGIESGFVRDGRFYTREEAAAAC